MSFVHKMGGIVRWESLRWIVHLMAWGLLAWLLIDYLTGNLTINPIQAATQRTGRYALTLLVLSLSCTPLYTYFGFRQAIPLRRWLGLYAFMFAVIHSLLFIGLDYGFNWQLLWLELSQKRFIVLGAIAWVILALLAATSFRDKKVRPGRGWKNLHRLVYIAAPLVVLHYAWSLKGDIFHLRGDILKPLVYGLVVMVLLLIRVPMIRKVLLRFRSRFEPEHVPEP